MNRKLLRFSTVAFILMFMFAIVPFRGYVVAPESVRAQMVKSDSLTNATLNIPSSSVNAIAQNGATGYFSMTLSKVPFGYDVTDGTYLGWCIDWDMRMSRNQTYTALMYSSLNPPSGNISNIRWDMVNYILNHKQGNASEIQSAIWFFANLSLNCENWLDVKANATVSDALANGTGFIPGPGQAVAVITWPYTVGPPSSLTFQTTIIEVQMPSPHVIPGDINGDGKVNLQDLVIFAYGYGSKPGDPNWNIDADFNKDGVIDQKDLAILASTFGQGIPVISYVSDVNPENIAGYDPTVYVTAQYANCCILSWTVLIYVNWTNTGIILPNDQGELWNATLSPLFNGTVWTNQTMTKNGDQYSCVPNAPISQDESLVPFFNGGSPSSFVDFKIYAENIFGSTISKTYEFTTWCSA